MILSRIAFSVVGLTILTTCSSLSIKPAAGFSQRQPSFSLGKSWTLQQAKLSRGLPKTSDRQMAEHPDVSIADLPNSVRQAVLQDALKRTQVNFTSVKIVSAKQKTWPNGCLGVSEPETVCTMVLVRGWQVTVQAGDQRLIYRTNASGSVVKLDPASSNGKVVTPVPRPANLPPKIARAVLRDLVQKTNLPVSTFRITQAERRTWSDSCLGLGALNELCAQVLVPGWQVVVEGGDRRWVYRTDAAGELVKLDTAASQSEPLSLQPVPLLPDELPPPLAKQAVLRAIASGGITGRTEQITLYRNGRIVRGLLSANGTLQERREYRVSPTVVQQFSQLLKQQFGQYNQLSYRAPSGAADFITVTLTSPQGTVQFADLVQPQLPTNLQQVIQAWSDLIDAP